MVRQAEAGVMGPQARGQQELPEAVGGRFPAELMILNFWPSDCEGTLFWFMVLVMAAPGHSGGRETRRGRWPCRV